MSCAARARQHGARHCSARGRVAGTLDLLHRVDVMERLMIQHARVYTL
jgi:hypothetical protein